MREHQIVITLKPEQFAEVQRLARLANAKSMGVFVRQQLLAVLGIEGAQAQEVGGQNVDVEAVLADLMRVHSELKTFVAESLSPYSPEMFVVPAEEPTPVAGVDSVVAPQVVHAHSHQLHLFEDDSDEEGTFEDGKLPQHLQDMVDQAFLDAPALGPVSALQPENTVAAPEIISASAAAAAVLPTPPVSIVVAPSEQPRERHLYNHPRAASELMDVPFAVEPRRPPVAKSPAATTQPLEDPLAKLLAPEELHGWRSKKQRYVEEDDDDDYRVELEPLKDDPVLYKQGPDNYPIEPDGQILNVQFPEEDDVNPASLEEVTEDDAPPAVPPSPPPPPPAPRSGRASLGGPPPKRRVAQNPST